MTTVVLVLSMLAFRALGAAGVHRFRTWRVSAAHALAVMLVMTGAAHFVPPQVTFMPNHADMLAMVPPFVPFPGPVVHLTGAFELLGALGLVLGTTRRWAGIALALMFVAMFPANVHDAVSGGPMATNLWLRTPEQLLYIGVALWAALPAGRRPQRGTHPAAPADQDRMRVSTAATRSSTVPGGTSTSS